MSPINYSSRNCLVPERSRSGVPKQVSLVMGIIDLSECEPAMAREVRGLGVRDLLSASSRDFKYLNGAVWDSIPIRLARKLGHCFCDRYVLE